MFNRGKQIHRSLKIHKRLREETGKKTPYGRKQAGTKSIHNYTQNEMCDWTQIIKYVWKHLEIPFRNSFMCF